MKTPRLPETARVVTHTPMKRFNMTKDKLRDFGLVAVLVAAAVVYGIDKDQEAKAKGDYYSCRSDDCRQQVQLQALNQQ